MKRFDIIKTVQLFALIIITVVMLIVIFRNPDLYHLIASDGKVKLIAGLLWAVLGISFVFLLYDFNSYSGLKRENIELDRAARTDSLTGIANRYSLDAYITGNGDALPDDTGCATIVLTSLPLINEKKGHAGGDRALRTFSELLEAAAGREPFVGRNGGSKFVVIIRGCAPEKLAAFSETLSGLTAQHNSTDPEDVLVYSIGLAHSAEEKVQGLGELVAVSDHRAA